MRKSLPSLRNVLSVRDVAVEDVMVPRADIRAVEAATTITDVAKVMSDSGHSRLPVYRSQLDDVIGMVHIKDLLACWDDDQETGITKIVRKPLLSHRRCRFWSFSFRCGYGAFTWRWSLTSSGVSMDW